MAILGQILARLGHFWALPKIFRNVSDHHRFQHKKYCGFGKFELLRRQSRRFSNHSTMVPHYKPISTRSWPFVFRSEKRMGLIEVTAHSIGEEE